jgi:hypothetical protein
MNETTLVIIAIVAALGLLSVIAVESISILQQQQAYAADRGNPGCANTLGLNANKFRCFHP